MKTIEEILREEVNVLKKKLIKIEGNLKNVPKGNLRISKKKDKVEYYYRNEEEGIRNHNGRYMKSSEKELIRRLAQRDYDEIA